MRERQKGGAGWLGVNGGEMKLRKSRRQAKGKAMAFQDEPGQSYIGFLRQNPWLQDVVDAPTFNPTMEEFEDPIKYIRSIEPMARKYGICKIKPPKELRNDVHLFSDGRKKDFHFTVRSQKMKEHHWEDFDDVDVLFDVAGSCTVDEFKKHANELAEDHIGGSAPMPPNFVEAEYWRQRSMNNGRSFYVEYGNDVEGSAFLKSDVPSVADTRWNLQAFGKDEGSVLRHLAGELPGITSPMLYIGAVFATFFWHVEDHFMHSINYMHCGAPKTWYGVPGECAKDFEQVCLEKVYKDALIELRKAGHSKEEVKALGLRNLMKKTTMFSPKHLVEAGVPVHRVVQKPGEFVVTFPRSYHGGFSHGFNIGEAVNFGLKEWFQQGEHAVKRYCWLRMQQILPHEELLVREAVHTEAKYRNGKGPLTPEDRMLFTQFLFFMNEQRLMRGVLVDRGMPVRPAFAVQQSQTCYTCGRKSFLAHIVTMGSQECHCLNCVCKEGVVSKDVRMFVNPVLPCLESVEGVLRPFVQRETPQPCQPDFHEMGMCLGDLRCPVSCSGASPTSTSTNINPAAEPKCWYGPGSGFSLQVGCESELCIEGKSYFRRVLLSNWGGKTRRLILLEEMLRAMGAPVDDPEDVQHVLGAFCEAVHNEPQLGECFQSGRPQRVQFINSQCDCEDGIVLGEDEARGILATLDGEVRERMAKFVKGLWEDM